MVYAQFKRDFTDDVTGALLTSPVTVQVRNEATGTLPRLFSDRHGLYQILNPATFPDGRVEFHCEGGAYRLDITSGALSRTLRYQGIARGSETDLVLVNPAGAWDAETTYIAAALVTVGDLVFISCTEQNLGNAPDSTTPGDTAYWMLLPTIAGRSAYTYVGYASDDEGADFATAPFSGATHVAFLSTDTEIGVLEAADFAGLWLNVKGQTGATGSAGAAGASAYVYVRYASDDEGADFSTTPGAGLVYIAIKQTTSPITSPVASDFDGLWVQYRQPEGQVILTQSSFDALDPPDANTIYYIVETV